MAGELTVRGLSRRMGVVLPPSKTFPNLIVNGSFDTDLSGWVNTSTPPAFVQWFGGKAQIVRPASGTARFDQTYTGLTPGQNYQFDCDIEGAASPVIYLGNTNSGSMQYFSSGVTAGHRTITFQATAPEFYLRFALFNQGEVMIDNVEMRALPIV